MFLHRVLNSQHQLGFFALVVLDNFSHIVFVPKLKMAQQVSRDIVRVTVGVSHADWADAWLVWVPLHMFEKAFTIQILGRAKWALEGTSIDSLFHFRFWYDLLFNYSALDVLTCFAILLVFVKICQKHRGATD